MSAEGEDIMCMSCGCEIPDDKHEDQRNITLHDLDQAALAANISVSEVVQNISNTWQKIGASHQASGEWGEQKPWQEVDTHGLNPGQYAPSLGSDPGSAWAEGQLMGESSQLGSSPSQDAQQQEPQGSSS